MLLKNVPLDFEFFVFLALARVRGGSKRWPVKPFQTVIVIKDCSDWLDNKDDIGRREGDRLHEVCMQVRVACAYWHLFLCLPYFLHA